MPSVIYHLVPQSYHRQQPANQPYTPAAFAEEGFIHCTADLDTLREVANAFFAGLPEPLLCYAIDRSKLTSPVKFEPPAPVPGAEQQPILAPASLFPHIYGPINREAIVEVRPLQRDSAGRWR